MKRLDPWVVLATLAHPVIVLDHREEIRYRNHAARADDLDPMSSADVRRAVRDVQSGRVPRASMQCAVRRRWLSVDLLPCAVGDRTGVVLEYRDITAIEDRFRTLVDGSPEIVFITDASSRMIYANAALEEQTGYTVADFQVPQQENRLIHPDDRERVARIVSEFIASGRKHSEPIQNRFVARDGRVLWLSSIVSRSEYAGEPVLHFVVHNITEQERARQELARMQSQLLERERFAALGELAAIVAHEIRNPISIIHNALTTLRKGPAQDDANMLLGIVEDEAIRLQHTVRDLLDFTRPMTPAIESCDLSNVLQEALVAAVAQQREASNIAVAFSAAPADYRADVDRQMIHRIVVNLVANAIQAMPGGGEIEVELWRDHSAISFAIADTGPGIPSDVAPRVFEPFFTTRATGTGLGLALVKRMVEMHGGTVALTETPSAGARFVATLPTSQTR